MGERGPVPLRRAEIVGHRANETNFGEDISHAPALEVKWYHADPEWHPIARQLYMAAKKSGQAIYYQQSDIALLYSICEDLSYLKNQDKRNGQMASTIYSALTGLLLSEGDRRRVRVELEAAKQEDEARRASNDFYASLGIQE